ncbi:MAG TPA: hypothetical protein VFC29_06190 [Candidatus Limnocylindrales bacterium]|nr:hypothetical protein [Candidatus Limnocylindrales bacterium]
MVPFSRSKRKFQLNHFRRRLTIGLLLVGVSSSYFFFSMAWGPAMLGSGINQLYAGLARSFLQGKATLPIEPPPELLSLPNPYDPEANAIYRLHDASLYKGHYYLYFGPVPVVTLFLPYRLVTGRDLPNRVAVPIFCIAGYLSSCILFFLLARHNRWALPFWLQCASIVSLGSMSLVSVMLRKPSFYQVAIAAGYFFVMAGFLVLARATLVCRSAGKWLLLAGLMFGLAVGCRPHFVVICVIVLGAFAIRARRSPGLVLAMAAGMAACGIVLTWYNYVRFDNPLEFGRTYQLTVFSGNPTSTYHGLELNLSGTLRSAEKFLFLAPRVNTTLPFLHTVLINPLVGRGGQPLWLEDMVGLIPAAPFALLGMLMPVFLRRRLILQGLFDEASAWLLYAVYWSGMAVLFILCVVGWVLDRYLVDFAPLFTFAGVAVAAMLWQSLAERPIKYIFSCVVGAATVYGAVLNMAFMMPRWEGILKFLGKTT